LIVGVVAAWANWQPHLNDRDVSPLPSVRLNLQARIVENPNWLISRFPDIENRANCGDTLDPTARR
jgi:hypothetical protein